MFLVVTHAFAPYQRGEAITDAAEIEAALAHHGDKVVRVDAAPAVSHAEPEHDADVSLDV